MKPFTDRVKSVEALLGASLPPDYLSFLLQPYSTPEKSVGVPFRGELWDIKDFLRLDDGKDYRQLDATFKLVYDVLPPHTLPLASDIADNFFCIIVEGERTGHIVWWDHERESGDNSVESVANSLSDFISSVTEFPNDNA